MSYACWNDRPSGQSDARPAWTCSSLQTALVSLLTDQFPTFEALAATGSLPQYANCSSPSWAVGGFGSTQGLASKFIRSSSYGLKAPSRPAAGERKMLRVQSRLIADSLSFTVNLEQAGMSHSSCFFMASFIDPDCSIRKKTSRLRSFPNDR